jgi:hypothetical protein
MRKYILLMLLVTTTYQVTRAQAVNLSDTGPDIFFPALSQAVQTNYGSAFNIETSIAQVGKYNHIVSANVLSEGDIKIGQEGKFNFAGVALVAPKANYQLMQYGNNNMLIDVGVSLRGEINRNITQYGQGSTINIQGSNEMINNMTIISRGSQNVYIKGINY